MSETGQTAPEKVSPEALDSKAIEAVDRSGQLQDILMIPDQLRDALWRVQSAGLGRREAPDGLIVAGMGGSAIG
ncbi:MAG TPA: hypothetical protein VE983_06710, partial [Solirubrobacteraceae bacterium]|nr:hypothetical protein [Solirubrobacteraceae bacterium]